MTNFPSLDVVLRDSSVLEKMHEILKKMTSPPPKTNRSVSSNEDQTNHSEHFERTLTFSSNRDGNFHGDNLKKFVLSNLISQLSESTGESQGGPLRIQAWQQRQNFMRTSQRQPLKASQQPANGDLLTELKSQEELLRLTDQADTNSNESLGHVSFINNRQFHMISHKQQTMARRRPQQLIKIYNNQGMAQNKGLRPSKTPNNLSKQFKEEMA